MDNKHQILLRDIAKDWKWRVAKAGKSLKVLGDETGISPPTITGAIKGNIDTRISVLQRIEDKLQEWGV